MKLTHWFLVLCALALVHPRVLRQEQARPVGVSPLIGDTLDTAERDRYHLFPNLAGFERAIFYLNPDTSLNVKVSLLEGGARRDTVIEGYRTLKAVQNQVRQFAQKDAEVELTGKLRAEEEEGAEVVLLRRNGQEMQGELLSVRDSSLVISTLEDFNPKDLTARTKGIVAIRNTEIVRVIIKGRSNVVKGMLIGTVAGAGFGALIGYASGDDSPSGWGSFALTAEEKALVLGALFGGIGFLYGTVGRIMGPSPDQEIVAYKILGYSDLNKFARYRVYEPEFLRELK